MLFEGKNTRKPDSRSRIGSLQIGHHADPSEDWVTDPELPVVLKNPYGGPGYEDVVVPMGRLIAVGEPVKIYTGKYKTKLTLANGVNPVIGVAPYNFCKDESFNDRFGGNKPAVIVDRYIRLPYIPDSVNSDMCPWGHATGDGITVGDFLKPTAKGQFTKWIEGTDSISQRVGQVLAKDLNQEELGWLKMQMWAEAEKYNDEIYQNYYNKTPEPSDNGGYPYTSGYPYTGEYRDGTLNMEKHGYMSEYQKEFIGIPGLTDGSGRQLTRHTNKVLGTVPTTAVDGDNLIMQIQDDAGGKAVNIINSIDPGLAFVLKVGGVEKVKGTANGEYQINHKTGQVVYKALASEADEDITIDFCMHYYGSQSYIDFQGAIGVLNVLLKL
jgi:hypothetical protein